MKLSTRWMTEGLLLAAGTLVLTFALQANAQVQTTTTEKAGESSQTVKVERGEVIAVEGRDLIVKMQDGSVQHFPNIPESARVLVGGKKLGIHDLKPGMKLQRTITTTTTPMTVTTIQTVKGRIWHINPPSSLILTLEDNTNQSFKIPSGQKFKVDGQMVDAFALRKGMQISATKIVETPKVVTTEKKSVTGRMPKAAAPVAGSPGAPGEAPAEGTGEVATIPSGELGDVPLLIAEGEPTPAPADTEASAAAAPAAPVEQKPETESHLPWIGLGLVLVIAGFAFWYIRRSKVQS